VFAGTLFSLHDIPMIVIEHSLSGGLKSLYPGFTIILMSSLTSCDFAVGPLTSTGPRSGWSNAIYLIKHARTPAIASLPNTERGDGFLLHLAPEK
jgi:hypothetical protein